MPFIEQGEAVKKGRAYWEREYRKVVANRDKLIRSIMRDMRGMEPPRILEEFAATQVNGLIIGFRRWIDETFPLQPGNRS